MADVVKQISVSATSMEGVVATFTGMLTVTEPTPKPIITSVTVTPASAPPGTKRTITVVARDPRGAGFPLSYTCLVDGAAATPVPGALGTFTFDA